MAKKTAPRTVDDYRAEVAAIVAEELEQFSPGDLRGHVRHNLRQNSFEIVTEALGLTHKWGRWEVDHCNGLRNRAADTMLSEAKTAAEEWLREQAGQLPELPKAAIKALHTDYLERLERAISDELRQRAQREACRLVDEMLSGKLTD